ncbi:alanine racemase [Nonomuraea candida]|uniref:alanine racemase n=1 Tax=Nonomuraea candida TaxID=359159 RepID=UPI001FE1117D|nr:alanine racemase [Nonomuraea candida]
MRDLAVELARAGELPAYVYHLPGLRAHVAAVRAAMAGVAQVFYAVKANPDARILRTLWPLVDGFEVASGGELAQVRRVVPEAPVAFGGPGKTDDELGLALRLGAERVHVESAHELSRLIAMSAGRPVDVLLRANPFPAAPDAVTPFGMDADGLAECAGLLRAAPWVRPRGVHVHLSWGQDAAALAGLAARVTAWALPWTRARLPRVARPEIDLGGGMGVDYHDPGGRFDWPAYAAALAGLNVPARLRVEPGRALTAYHGWYVTDVLDVKRNHGRRFGVLRGGTHHLRTPVARGHDQPCAVIPLGTGGPSAPAGPITLVGQLCTPKDVLARDLPAAGLRVGDVVVFALAGAYAYNLSHHDFLMHPKPRFHYLDPS